MAVSLFREVLLICHFRLGYTFGTNYHGRVTLGKATITMFQSYDPKDKNTSTENSRTCDMSTDLIWGPMDYWHKPGYSSPEENIIRTVFSDLEMQRMLISVKFRYFEFQ